MWHRTAEVEGGPDDLTIRDDPGSSPECRLRAALLRWPPCGRGASGPSRPSIAGIAWNTPVGEILWGWPEEDGSIRLRPGHTRPEVCALIPPALALVLALRRKGVELGARTLIIGEGFLGRLAGTVARHVGCRVQTSVVPDSEPAPRDLQADVVIETTGEPRSLSWALACSRDWGLVYSLGGALSLAPVDYYPDVHRRALTVIHLSMRPQPTRDEEDVVERGIVPLGRALEGMRLDCDEALEVRVLTQGGVGRVERERGGWGQLRFGEG